MTVPDSVGVHQKKATPPASTPRDTMRAATSDHAVRVCRPWQAGRSLSEGLAAQVLAGAPCCFSLEDN